MGIYSRSTPYLALLGMLALGAPTALRAQQPTNAPPKDTSAMAQPDTGAYQGYQRNDSTADTTGKAGQGGYKYNGPPSDTALKAKPGVQTGPTADSSRRASGAAGVTASADTVVCKDGSNAAKKGNGCASHGGIDWAATKSAMKARGHVQMGDTTGAAADTSKMKDSSSSKP
ncbi:MAG TPA: hypothetical protein VHR41_19330 [Gemmatimonadales bacterium]|nr:hypothetical protein [Gemmatimonadales bacterium]